MDHVERYFTEASRIAQELQHASIDELAQQLVSLREGNGRLFLLGVGGSAANCGHAVNDFRKLCGIEAYAPTDNVSELTARTNDEGWDTVFAAWLRVSRLTDRDALFVFSVGGGNLEKNVSANLVKAIEFGKSVGCRIFGVVGPQGGHTAKVGDVVIKIPVGNDDQITPHTEAFQAVVWHCLVSHPLLQVNQTKW